jgi:hypothetical protein
MKRSEADGRSEGNAKGYSDGKSGASYDNNPNSSDSNYATQYKYGYAEGYAKGKMEVSPEPAFNLPDLPMTVKATIGEIGDELEIQINKIVFKRGVDGNKPDAGKTTVTLSCEILQIPDSRPGNPPPYITVFVNSVSIYDGISRGGHEGGASTVDLGLFNKQVGDTFEANVVLDYGYPDLTITDPRKYQVGNVRVYLRYH